MNKAVRKSGSTLRDIAARTGVSHVTVSRVLNGKAGVAPVTRQAVLEAVRTLRYRPNAAARALVKGRQGRFPLSIEVLLCHLRPLDERPAGSFQMQVLQGVHDAARADGQVEIRLSYHQEGSDPEEQMTRLFRANGVLLMGNSDRLLAEAILAHKHLAVVLADHEHEDLPADLAISDNIAGGRMAVRHLLERGHRRIGWLGGPFLYTANRQRLDGVRLALQEAGLGLAAADCRVAEENEPAAFERLTEAWARTGDLPSAIIVGSSFPMPAIIHALREHGCRCPDDISLVCFDHDVYTAACRPEPTTLATFPREIGRRAVERLIRLARAENPEPPMKIIVPMRLVEGDSVRTIAGAENPPRAAAIQRSAGNRRPAESKAVRRNRLPAGVQA